MTGADESHHERFEAWMRDAHPRAYLGRMGSTYTDLGVAERWEAWCAAKADGSEPVNLCPWCSHITRTTEAMQAHYQREHRAEVEHLISVFTVSGHGPA